MDRRQLTQAMHAVMDGEATAEQRLALDHALTVDPAAREEFLHHLASICVLQAVAAEQAIGEGLVERDELDPGGVILRISQPHEQTGAGGGGEGHGLYFYTQPE